MAETSDEILEHIESKRNQLGQSIDQLESYVRDKTDVRAHFGRKPWAFIGGAALGGLLLASMILPNGGKRRESTQRPR